jgi:hypothetical protein
MLKVTDPIRALGELVQVSLVDDLPASEVAHYLQINKYMILRGLVEPAAVLEARKKLHEAFSPENDHPSMGVDPELTKTNFQKWAVGTISPSSDKLARCCRIFYNPLWCEDVYGLHKCFEILIEVRNKICNIPRDYAKKQEPDGAYAACRIQHYPKGGGFMGGHVDGIGIHNLQQTINPKFIQVLLVMTKRGVDFKAGGAYVVREGEKLFYEARCEIGDVVLYDGSALHGVDDIDPTSPFCPHILNGRIVAMAVTFNARLADDFRNSRKVDLKA